MYVWSWCGHINIIKADAGDLYTPGVQYAYKTCVRTESVRPLFIKFCQRLWNVKFCWTEAILVKLISTFYITEIFEKLFFINSILVFFTILTSYQLISQHVHYLWQFFISHYYRWKYHQNIHSINETSKFY